MAKLTLRLAVQDRQVWCAGDHAPGEPIPLEDFIQPDLHSRMISYDFIQVLGTPQNAELICALI